MSMSAWLPQWGVSILWRIEFKREIQPLGNNLTLNEMRVFEDKSTEVSGRQPLKDLRGYNNNSHQIDGFHDDEKETMAQMAMVEFLFKSCS